MGGVWLQVSWLWCAVECKLGTSFFPWYHVSKHISWNNEVSEIWSEENTFWTFAKWQICTLQSDKFALASEVCQRFIDNCFLCYRPGENLIADEQLFPSKARCRFTQYMANKPDKFGIKFRTSVDNDTTYIYVTPSHTWEKINYVLLMNHSQRVL